MIFIDNEGNTNPHLNLALEEYIVRNFGSDNDYLLFYINEPSIIIGKNQITVEEVNHEYIENNAIHVVRRVSGGGAVYHDFGNLNFSFITNHDITKLHNFKQFTEPVIQVLNDLGLAAELKGRNDIQIDEKDLREDTYRSSGKGGQHVNKTDSAVRLTHLPTGIVVACQNDRSQHKNRSTAMSMLKARLYEKYEDEKRSAMEKVYGEKGEIGWGNQIRSYVFQPYQMVKDLRTGVETSVAHLHGLLAARVGLADPEVVRAPERPGELRRSALAPGRASIHLGWKPWTSLDDGAAEVVRWERSKAG